MIRRSLPALTLVLGLAGCGSPASYYPVAPAVPALEADVIPKAPVSAQPMIWQPGHWDWNGNSYAWVAGRYVSQASAGVAWQSGFWSLRGGQYEWTPAHWI